MAYIKDVGNNDVRSEGMSYGMMICVQLDKKTEFDRLWKWARTYMYQSSGEFKGYFGWQANTNGQLISTTPASDGEEYFAMSLFFAANRWGNGSGIFNYKAEAQAILDAMLHQADDGVGVNMFNTTQKQVVFCPIGNAATFTDPSYHLPSFYKLWALWADKDNTFWEEAATTSRSFFRTATNSTTGLGPDYAEFNGVPNNTGGHGDYRFDAWRIAANIAMDYAWWAADSWQKTFSDRIQNFFYSQGIGAYANQYTLTGTPLSTEHSPGHVAMNAVSGLASTTTKTWDFVDELWNMGIPSGTWRYYDGCLYLFGLLQCSGKYKIWKPSGSPSPTPTVSPTPTPTVTPTPTPTVSPTPTPTPAPGGYSQIEAESYSSQSGTSNVSGDGGTVVNYNNSSSWTAYTVDFGSTGPSSVNVRGNDPGYGANIVFRIDSPTGSSFATVYPSGGGVWNTKSNTCYPKPTGVHTVYVSCTGSNVKINWFKFIQ